MNAITPETTTTCHQFWSNATSLEMERRIHGLSRTIFEAIEGTFREDQALLKAQQIQCARLHPELNGYPPLWDVSFVTDKAALRGRRAIERMIADDLALRRAA